MCSFPSGCAPGRRSRSGDAVSGRLPAHPPGTGTPRARHPRAGLQRTSGADYRSGGAASSRRADGAPRSWRPEARGGRTAEGGTRRPLGTVVLFARDLDRGVEFYTAALGLRAVEREDGWVALDAGGVRLALHAIPRSI